MRRALQLEDNGIGVLVASVTPEGPCDGVPDIPEPNCVSHPAWNGVRWAQILRQLATMLFHRARSTIFTVLRHQEAVVYGRFI